MRLWKDWEFLFRRFILGQDAREYNVIKRAKRFSGELFIDIGSNAKRFSDALQPNFKRVITIDPNPKWNAEYQIALSSYRGEAPFYIGDNQGGADSLMHNPYILGRTWLNVEFTRMVKVVRYDDLELDADLVKIDVEGSEFDILEGMQKHLPKNLIIELHDERRKDELLEVVRQKGYKVSRIDTNHWLFTRKDVSVNE